MAKEQVKDRAAAGERSELIACLLLIVVGAVIAAGVL